MRSLVNPSQSEGVKIFYHGPGRGEVHIDHLLGTLELREITSDDEMTCIPITGCLSEIATHKNWSVAFDSIEDVVVGGKK